MDFELSSIDINIRGMARDVDGWLTQREGERERKRERERERERKRERERERE